MSQSSYEKISSSASSLFAADSDFIRVGAENTGQFQDIDSPLDTSPQANLPRGISLSACNTSRNSPNSLSDSTFVKRKKPRTRPKIELDDESYPTPGARLDGVHPMNHETRRRIILHDQNSPPNFRSSRKGGDEIISRRTRAHDDIFFRKERDVIVIVDSLELESSEQESDNSSQSMAAEEVKLKRSRHFSKPEAGRDNERKSVSISDFGSRQNSITRYESQNDAEFFLARESEYEGSRKWTQGSADEAVSEKKSSDKGAGEGKLEFEKQVRLKIDAGPSKVKKSAQISDRLLGATQRGDSVNPSIDEDEANSDSSRRQPFLHSDDEFEEAVSQNLVPVRSEIVLKKGLSAVASVLKSVVHLPRGNHERARDTHANSRSDVNFSKTPTVPQSDKLPGADVITRDNGRDVDEHMACESFLPFKCDKCPHRMRNRRLLKIHLEGHQFTRKLSCPHCDWTANRLDYLYAHMKFHKEVDEETRKRQERYRLMTTALGEPDANHFLNFICDQCGKGFRRKDHLKSHQTVHSERKPHKCDKCTQTFKRRLDFISHSEVCPKGAQACPQCPRVFRNRAQLARHSLEHMQLICNLCERRFKNLQALETHARFRHKSEEERAEILQQLLISNTSLEGRHQRGRQCGGEGEEEEEELAGGKEVKEDEREGVLYYDGEKNRDTSKSEGKADKPIKQEQF